jgi:L-methionine (R)-S-oxide reductase
VNILQLSDREHCFASKDFCEYRRVLFCGNLRDAIYLCIMADDLQISKGTKEEQYKELLPQIKGLLEGEPDLVANLANIAGALKEQFNWLWIGFYLVKKDELVLGPFQGPVACTRIKKGRGVCGGSWEKAATLIVPDVEKFPGHIACSSLSRSEIVVPIIRNGEVVGVLDADSELVNHYDETDRRFLEEIVTMIDYRN